MGPDRLLDSTAVLAAAAILTICTVPPGPAQAQQAEGSEPGSEQSEGSPQQVDLKDEEARRLFEAARLAFQDGRFEDALRSFRRAYELSDRPGLLYNIGTAADRLRHDEEAIEAFEEYLEQAPDAPNRGEVERRLEVLRAHAGRADTEPAEQASEPGAEETDTGAEPEAPTPEQAAAASLGGEPGSQRGPAAPPSDEGDGGIAGAWWLWTIVGVVVLGGAAAGLGFALAGGGGQDGLSDTDWTVSALGESR